MTPAELQDELKRGLPLVLIDVREIPEWDHVRIDGAKHIPLGTLPQRAGELEKTAHTVVYCHHGMRSARAVGILRQAGFTDAHNLEGGIDRWSVEIDPAKPRYG